jgi:hypothetical protein
MKVSLVGSLRRRCGIPHHALRGLAAAAAVSSGAAAHAGVSLITLPPRQRVEIQLDNPDVTLVEEERIVPLAQGGNDVVFAWANAAIDRGTIQLRCLTDPQRIRVLSVAYPPGENKLTWRVWSPAAGSARVRISYVIGGLERSFAYRAVATPDEKLMSLWQYLDLHNRAGESFGAAGMWAGFGERLERPIGADETKRLLAARFDRVPVRKTYTADLASYGYLDAGRNQLLVPMHYVLRNDAGVSGTTPARGPEADGGGGGLGSFPLMPGKARIFQDDGRGTVAFLGEDWAPLVPPGGEAALFLGVARDVVVVRTIERRVARRVMGPLQEYDVVVRYQIENFKDEPVVLNLAESMGALRAEVLGDTGRAVEWTLGTDGTLQEPDPEKSVAERPVFHVTLPPRGPDGAAVKQSHALHVVIRNEW